MPVRALDAAVLVGDAGIVAGRRHAVMDAQGVVAAGQVLLCVPVQVAEGGRQAVGAMPARRGAPPPDGGLPAFGPGPEPLPAENDNRMPATGVGQPALIRPAIHPTTRHPAHTTPPTREVRPPPRPRPT